jgi:hypothetical protein
MNATRAVATPTATTSLVTNAHRFRQSVTSVGGGKNVKNENASTEGHFLDDAVVDDDDDDDDDDDEDEDEVDVDEDVDVNDDDGSAAATSSASRVSSSFARSTDETRSCISIVRFARAECGDHKCTCTTSGSTHSITLLQDQHTV